MNEKPINLDALRDKFDPEDIEWRVQRAGKGQDGKIWAWVVPYITNRAIMERLDSVVGPGSWKNEYFAGPGGGVCCCLSIKIDGEWVGKVDGSDNTDIEPIKGGLSTSMKRAAVHWGIGRYLYDLEPGRANIHDQGAHYSSENKKTGVPAFKWDPPLLPASAVPANYYDDEEKEKRQQRGRSQPAKSKPNGNGAGHDPPPSGRYRGTPGSEVSAISTRLATLQHAPDERAINRVWAQVEGLNNSGEITAEDYKRLEDAKKERLEKLGVGAGADG
jgi:hypothetical protein